MTRGESRENAGRKTGKTHKKILVSLPLAVVEWLETKDNKSGFITGLLVEEKMNTAKLMKSLELCDEGDTLQAAYGDNLAIACKRNDDTGEYQYRIDYHKANEDMPPFNTGIFNNASDCVDEMLKTSNNWKMVEYKEDEE